MNKKFSMTPRELILNSSKDYSYFTKDELIHQYKVIINQYDEFKNKMITDIDLKNVNPNIVNIRNIQKRIQQDIYANVLMELDNHLKIMKDLIDKS